VSQVLERHHTPRGELALRRTGDDLELIINGAFVMSTSNGASERALVRLALEGREAVNLLIGGLGVGFSLAEALAHPTVREVVVVEVEPRVVGWGRTVFEPYNGGALRDPRVTVECADLDSYVSTCDRSFDVVCLDVDNGPGWLVHDDNAALYSESGLSRLYRVLASPGRLALWASEESPEFEARLARVFDRVSVRSFPVERGADDVVYLSDRGAAARRQRARPGVR
jgi:spermidine synthase